MNPEFGNRLAGFIDGEGHFAIIQQSRKRAVVFSCGFALNLRDDELEALERFRDETGLGVIYQGGDRYKQSPNAHPLLHWRIQRRRECLAFVEILDDYPLWTTKARDYAIWRQAVRYWNGPRPLGWAPMEVWFREIRDVRQYRAPQRDTVDLEIASLFDLADTRPDS